MTAVSVTNSRRGSNDGFMMRGAAAPTAAKIARIAAAIASELLT
jgi:hypothetical protein